MAFDHVCWRRKNANRNFTHTFFCETFPRSIIVLHASETESRNFLSGKLDPALRANPALARCFVSRRSPDGVFNNQFRDFSGGALMCSWGGSLKTLRQRSAAFCFIDESEQMDTLQKGTSSDIIAERSSTFPNRLVMECSTPGDKGVSRIDSVTSLVICGGGLCGVSMRRDASTGLGRCHMG